MGMMDKFRGWMGVDDDYDEEYEYIEEKEVPAPSRKRAAKEIKEKESVVMDNPYMGDVEVTKRSNKVVNIAATTQLSVVLVKPERFENAAEIADHLRDRRTVVLNLEDTNKEIARRLIDFLSGVTYSLEGKIKKVANNTFIITPYTVDIMGDLIDELENNGLYN